MYLDVLLAYIAVCQQASVYLDVLLAYIAVCQQASVYLDVLLAYIAVCQQASVYLDVLLAYIAVYQQALCISMSCWLTLLFINKPCVSRCPVGLHSCLSTIPVYLDVLLVYIADNPSLVVCVTDLLLLTHAHLDPQKAQLYPGVCTPVFLQATVVFLGEIPAPDSIDSRPVINFRVSLSLVGIRRPPASPPPPTIPTW